MDITIRYMLRAVAHCKEGCSRLSWVRRKTAYCFYTFAARKPYSFRVGMIMAA